MTRIEGSLSLITGDPPEHVTAWIASRDTRPADGGLILRDRTPITINTDGTLAFNIAPGVAVLSWSSLGGVSESIPLGVADVASMTLEEAVLAGEAGVNTSATRAIEVLTGERLSQARVAADEAMRQAGIATTQAQLASTQRELADGYAQESWDYRVQANDFATDASTAAQNAKTSETNAGKHATTAGNHASTTAGHLKEIDRIAGEFHVERGIYQQAVTEGKANVTAMNAATAAAEKNTNGDFRSCGGRTPCSNRSCTVGY